MNERERAYTSSNYLKSETTETNEKGISNLLDSNIETTYLLTYLFAITICLFVLRICDTFIFAYGKIRLNVFKMDIIQ